MHSLKYVVASPLVALGDGYTAAVMPSAVAAASCEWQYLPEWVLDIGDDADQIVVVWRDMTGSWWSGNDEVVAPATEAQLEGVREIRAGWGPIGLFRVN